MTCPDIRCQSFAFPTRDILNYEPLSLPTTLSGNCRGALWWKKVGDAESQINEANTKDRKSSNSVDSIPGGDSIPISFWTIKNKAEGINLGQICLQATRIGDVGGTLVRKISIQYSQYHAMERSSFGTGMNASQWLRLVSEISHAKFFLSHPYTICAFPFIRSVRQVRSSSTMVCNYPGKRWCATFVSQQELISEHGHIRIDTSLPGYSHWSLEDLAFQSVA